MKNINKNTEYLNWPGLKKLVNNINILPKDEWHLNKEYLNWPGLKELVENKNILPEEEWSKNKEYLKLLSSAFSEADFIEFVRD